MSATMPRWVARTLAVAALVVSAALMAVVISRADEPAPPLTGARVAASLAGEVDVPQVVDGYCLREGRRRWMCDALDGSGSRAATYRVKATSRSCWRGTRLHPRHSDLPRTEAACLE